MRPWSSLFIWLAYAIAILVSSTWAAASTKCISQASGDHSLPTDPKTISAIQSHIEDFCIASGKHLATAGQSLSKNWTIGSYDLEIDEGTQLPSEGCNGSLLSADTVEKSCRLSLNHLLDQCDEPSGIFYSDDCRIWSLMTYYNPSRSSKSLGTLKTLAARTLSSDEAKTLCEAGIDLMNELVSAVDGCNSKEADLLSKDVLESQFEDKSSLKLYNSLAGAFRPYMGSMVKKPFYESVVYDKKDDDLFYKNAMSPENKLIMAFNNHGNLGKDRRAKQRWHTVVWYFWNKQCEEKGISPSELRWIYRWMINNPKTLEMIKAVRSGREDEPRVKLSRSDVNFYKVLATQNGRGVQRLLADHPETLNKFIKHIYVEKERIMFELEDVTSDLDKKLIDKTQCSS